MEMMLDASAIMAIILNEPNRDKVIFLTRNTILLSPEVITFEIGNALVNLLKRKKINEEQLYNAYKIFNSIPLRIVEVNVEKAIRIACKYMINAYDAYYLETAFRLKVPLITFDVQMEKVALELRIRVRDKTAEEENDENL